MEDTTPVVVIEEKKKRRGLLWVGLGTAVLLSGGSTFALWSASDTFTGGTITAGDLNLVQQADTTFYDVSADRTDATTVVPGTDGSQLGHAIDEATWRIVPGDKVAAAFSADVTLEGDNLVGKLSIDGFSGVTDGNPDLVWSYQIYSGGDLLVDESALPGNGTLLYLSAPGAGQADGQEDGVVKVPTPGGGAATTVFTLDDTSETFTVVVYGTFNDVDDRTDVTTADTLSDLDLKLDQVRDTGAIFQ